MKRRCFVMFPANSVGGAENVLKRLVVEFVRRGFEVDVLCLTKGTGELFPNGYDSSVNVTVLPTWKERYGAFLGFLHILKNDAAYDLSVSSHVQCNALLALMKRVRLLHTNWLICRESTIINRRFRGVRRIYFKLLYAFYSKEIDLLICQTEEMQREVLEFLPLGLPRKTVVIGNPTSPDCVERRISPVRSAPIFVSVGRLIFEKGFDVLVTAFQKIRFTYPSARLKIFGEGPEWNALNSQVLALGLAESVDLCGSTKRPLSVMQEADVCVLSSRIEGFPNTLLEMMKANSRVVATTCADGIENIKGLVICEPNDSGALAGAMIAAVHAGLEAAPSFDMEIRGRMPSGFVDRMFGELARCDFGLDVAR